MKKDGILINDSKSKAEILLNQFKSVFTKVLHNNPLPALKDRVKASLVSIKIQNKGVEKLLNSIDPT